MSLILLCQRPSVWRATRARRELQWAATSVTDIFSPHRRSDSASTRPEGISVDGFYGADPAPASPLPAARGVTVSSNDCEPVDLRGDSGLLQHGVRLPMAIEAGACLIVTDEVGRPRGFERPLRSSWRWTNPRTIVPLLCRNIYLSPATRVTTMAVTGTNGKTTTSTSCEPPSPPFPRVPVRNCGNSKRRPRSFEAAHDGRGKFVSSRQRTNTTVEKPRVIELSPPMRYRSIALTDVFDVAAFTNPSTTT